MAEAVGLLLLLLALVFFSAVVHSSAPSRRRPGDWVERRLAKRSARCTHHYAVCRLLHTRTADPRIKEKHLIHGVHILIKYIISKH